MLPRILLGAAVLISPWLYGSVHEWSQVWLFLLLIAAMACTLVLQITGKYARDKLPLAIPILLLALGWGAVQLVPLPKPFASWASPHAVQLREQLLPSDSPAGAALPEALGVTTDLSGQTVSLRPESTRYHLALLALGVSAFYLASQLFASPKSQLWLYSLVAANGAFLAFFGLVQRMTWNGQLFWIGRYPSGGSPFASFVSRNSAGGYLNLCLAAALALAIWALRKGGERRADSGARGPESGGPTAEGQSAQESKSPRARLRRPRSKHQAQGPKHEKTFHSIASSFATLNATKITAVALPALLFGGILCTASRGATVSALAAALLVAPALVYYGRWRGRVLLILAVGLLGIGLVGWVGMQDLVQDRLGTLTDREELSAEGRLLHWRDSIRAAPHFWQTGSGLGTYRDVYLLYERHRFSSWFYHAENQYLEALIEGGAVGLLLMLLAIACVAFANFRVLANRNATPAVFACGVVGLFALATQAVHAFFDFSLYLPANMLLLAVFCGATTSLANTLRAESNRQRAGGKSQRTENRVQSTEESGQRTEDRVQRAEGRGTKSQMGDRKSTMVLLSALRSPASAPAIENRKSRIANVLVSALLLGCLVAGWREVQYLIPVKQARRDADFTVHPRGATQAELEEAMKNFEPLLRDDDAESHYVLAKLQTHLYRLKSLDKLRKATTSDVSLDQLWNRTSPESLHRQIQQLKKQQQPNQLEKFKNAALVQEHLIPALKHLLMARRACPVLSKVHLRIAPLSVLAAGPTADEIHLERACQVRPSSAYTWHKAGRLDMQAARTQAAYRRFRRCLEISPGYLPEVLEFAGQHAPFSEIVSQALPQSPTFLLDTAEQRFAGEANRDNRTLLAQRALDLLRKSDAPEPERQHMVGRALTLLERYPQAMKAYLYAVEREVNRTQECIVVLKGRLRARVYDEDDRLLEEVTVSAHEGMIMLAGGHGYEILDEGTLVIETKNGPYPGAEVDRRRF